MNKNMNKTAKILITALVLGLSLAIVASAEEAVKTSAEATIDENIQAADLGVSEPTVLPDSPFYFLKNLGRTIQDIVTLDPVKKAELKEKIANEKILEAKKLVEKGANPEKVKQAVESYQQDVAKITAIAQTIKEKAETSSSTAKFLDKYIQQQTLHQQILEKLETKVSSTTLKKIQEAREKHLENFAEVMTKLENKEKIQQRVENNLEQIKGSDFKAFQNLEVLKNLEEKAPEQAKEALQKAQQTIMNRLQEKLESTTTAQQDKFRDYIEKISGDKEKQMEILQNLKTTVKNATATANMLRLKEKLQQTEIKVLQKIENKIEKTDCPAWKAPAADFCTQGRIYIPKDPSTNCPLEPKCIMPSESSTQNNQACVMVWDPVCGSNGKTYSNACLAKIAGVSVVSKGVCKTENSPSIAPTQPTCKDLWWFDKTSTVCQQKKFCGAYMYLGLRTFSTQEECQAALKKILSPATSTAQ